MDRTVIFSFDVEEHDRIEAAAGLTISQELKAHYRDRLAPSTHLILEELAHHGPHATFFILGQIAQHSPGLVREIHDAGHEVASHGWDHRRVTTMTAEEFRDDVRKSKDALEQVTGEAVVGYRAPTFSIGTANPWAIDALAEEGMIYDSSIFPVRHDRYGVPGAPRGPFIVHGNEHSLIELPPATWRICGANVPMGGGGYFRLFPLWWTEHAIRQIENCESAIATLYFHPWEFDPGQQRLPLNRVSRFRTYVGMQRTRSRLTTLLNHRRSRRAIDVAKSVDNGRHRLPHFGLGSCRISTTKV